MTAPRPAEFGWPGGDVPGELQFQHPIAAPLRLALREALAGLIPGLDASAEIHALTPPAGAIGRFSIQGRGPAIFVRVSARQGDAQLEQAITGYLKDRGVAVNHLEIAGAALCHEGISYRMDVRELIAGRHFDGSLEDLRSLAAALAACHLHLRTFPRAEAVRRHAAERFRQLDGIRAEMAAALDREDWTFFHEDPAWAAAHADWLGELVRDFAPAFDGEPGAQCLHAQIHRANVLYRLSDARPVLVDWEEAVQTFAPSSWDLAYFIQRFCLHDDPDLQTFATRLAAVRSAYASAVPGIAEMMRQIAWLSMVILVRNRQRGGLVNPTAEYDKFVRLERQARALASIIDGGLIAA